jgi:hypothetical protein
LFIASDYERLTYALKHGFQVTEIPGGIWWELVESIMTNHLDYRDSDQTTARLFAFYRKLGVPLPDTIDWNPILCGLISYPETFSFFYDLVISQDSTFEFSFEPELESGSSPCMTEDLNHLFRAGVTAEELLDWEMLQTAMRENSVQIGWWIQEDLGLPDGEELDGEDWEEALEALLPELYHKLGLYILSKGRYDLFNKHCALKSYSLLKEACELGYITQEDLEELRSQYHVNTYMYRNIDIALKSHFR